MEDPAIWTERPAGFWIRWLARFVDGFVVGLPVMIVGAVLTGILAVAMHKEPMAAMFIAYGIFWLLFFVSNGIYYTVLTARSGQTLGKKLYNLKVVRLNGEGLSVGRSLGRWGGYFLSAIPMLLGYVVAAFPDKRALHDYVSDTKVVRTGPMGTPAVVVAWIAGFFFLLIPLGGIMAAIAIPSFSHMKAQAQDVSTRVGQGSIQAGLGMYLADNGQYPDRLEDLVEGKTKYLEAIPQEKITNSNRTSKDFDGSGGWAYAPKSGKVFVNVNGQDSKGQVYRDYGN